jgi:heme-degrading monooxygenase HmoA
MNQQEQERLRLAIAIWRMKTAIAIWRKSHLFARLTRRKRGDRLGEVTKAFIEESEKYLGPNP